MFPANTPQAPNAAGQGRSGFVTAVTIPNFMKEVIEASLQVPVLLLFWAQNSPMSKQLMAALEKLVEEQRGAIRLATAEMSAVPEIAQQMRVQSVPATYAFFQGKPVDGFMGTIPEAQLRQWFGRVMQMAGHAAPYDPAAELEPALQQAEEFLATGNWQEAQEIFGDIATMMPDNAQAYAGVVRCMIAAGSLEQAKTIFAAAPETLTQSPYMQQAQAALELAEQAAGLGSVAELQAAVQADANNHQARFDLATALLAQNKREEAIDHLLEIVSRDRKWEDDAARRQLVKLFEVFGATDPLTLSARRRLSSLLFV